MRSSVTGFVLKQRGKDPENISSIAISFETLRPPVATCENFDRFLQQLLYIRKTTKKK